MHRKEWPGDGTTILVGLGTKLSFVAITRIKNANFLTI